jgi:hypothetical protein
LYLFYALVVNAQGDVTSVGTNIKIGILTFQIQKSVEIDSRVNGYNRRTLVDRAPQHTLEYGKGSRMEEEVKCIPCPK